MQLPLFADARILGVAVVQAAAVENWTQVLMVLGSSNHPTVRNWWRGYVSAAQSELIKCLVRGEVCEVKVE